MSSETTKLLVIGFDGLDCQLFKRHSRLDVDAMPLYAPVAATGPSWTSIYTGDSTSRHGVLHVFGLEHRRRYAAGDTMHHLILCAHQLGRRLRGLPPYQRYETCETTPSTYVWDTLGRAGLTVKLVNMPITWPVRPVRGVHIAGFPVIKRRNWYYPPELGPTIPQDYAELCDPIHWFQDPERDSHRVWKRGMARLGAEEARKRLAANANRLIELSVGLERADLEMIQFSFVDRLGHIFHVSGEIEQFCYEQVDRIVELLLNAVQPQAAVIVSDHGFQGAEHTDYGVLAAAGVLRERMVLREGYTPSVLDVAPTVAGYFGLSHQCEGNNLLSAEKYQSRDQADDQAERKVVMDLLKNLGYM